MATEVGNLLSLTIVSALVDFNVSSRDTINLRISSDTTTDIDACTIIRSRLFLSTLLFIVSRRWTEVRWWWVSCFPLFFQLFLWRLWLFKFFRLFCLGFGIRVWTISYVFFRLFIWVQDLLYCIYKYLVVFSKTIFRPIVLVVNHIFESLTCSNPSLA